MQPQHRIEEMIVDLSFSTTRLARCEKNKLIDWLSDELLPALDKLFSYYVPGDQILRLDQLEFDFGNLASHNYQQVIGERLIAALTQILEQQLLAIAPQFSVSQSAMEKNLAKPSAAEEARTQGNKLALQQLFSYLNNGQIRAHRIDTLPHTAATSPTITTTADIHSATTASTLKQSTLKIKLAGIHEQLLAQVLGEQDIATLLRELPQRQALIQRLTKQFSEQYRVELLQQLAPHQTQIALALLDWLHVMQTSATRSSNQFHSSKITANNGHTTPENMRAIPVDILWEALLDIALSQPTLSETAWLKLLLEKLAARLNVSESELVSFFPLQNIKQWNSNHSASDALGQLAESLNKILKGSSITSIPASLPSTTSIPVSGAAESNPLVSLADTSGRLQTQPQVPIAQQRSGLSATSATHLDVAGDQRLFELCLNLKSGSLPWAQFSANADLLKRLIESFIRLGQSVAAEHSGDFLSAIITHAPLSQYKASYYLQVLQRLLANELIDLEAIVDGLEKQLDQAMAHTNVSDKEAIDPFTTHDQQKEFSPSPELATIEAAHSALENTIPEIVTSNPELATIEAAHSALENTIPEIVTSKLITSEIVTSETINLETVSSEGAVLKRIAPARIASKKDALENRILEDSGIESAIGSVMDTDELANALLTGNRILASLQLNIPEWQLLVAAILRKKFFISAATTNHFISAVQYALTDSTQPTVGYRALIARLMTIETLDAEAIIAALKLQTRHLTWNRLSTAADFLPRIVRSYINFFPSLFRAGYADLVDPIESQTAAMGNNIQFYQQLLNLLFNAMAFDADTFDFLLTNDNLERGIQGLLKNTINKTSPSAVSRDSVNASANAGLFGSTQNPHVVFPVVDATINNFRRNEMESPSSNPINPGYLLEELATGLLKEKISLSQLDLPLSQWQQLVAVMIKQKYSVSATDINSLLSVLIDPLLSAGADQSVAVNNYRATIARIIAIDALDIEAIVAAMKLQMRHLSWEMIEKNPDMLQRILHAYIEFSGKIAVENQHDFIAMIDRQAKTSAYPNEFYLQVLNRLFGESTLDLEEIHQYVDAQKENLSSDIASGLSDSQQNTGDKPYPKIPVVQSNELSDFYAGDNIDQPLLNKSSVDKSSAGKSRIDKPKQYKLDGIATNPVPPFVMLANALVAKDLSLTDLAARTSAFSDTDWSQLLSCLFQATQTAVIAPELQQAITQFAAQARNRTNYYLQIVAALMAEHSIDLEAFAALDKAPMTVDSKTLDSKTVDSKFGETVSTLINDAANNNTEQNRQREKQYPVDQHEPQTMTHQQDQHNADGTAADCSRDGVSETLIQPHTLAVEAKHNPIQSLMQNSVQSSIQSSIQSQDAFTNESKDVPLGKIALAQLLAQDNPGREQLLALQQQLNRLLHKTSAALTAEWQQALTNPEFCARLIRVVPGHLLHQLCNHLLPQLFIPLEQIVKLVSDVLTLLIPNIDQLRFKQVKWEFIFQQLFAGGTPISDRAQLTRECCLQLAARIGFDDVESLIKLAQRRLVLLKPPTQLKPTMSLKDLGLDTAATDTHKSEDWAAGLSINNAGQVLVAPYLPRLFSMLNLTQEGKFIHFGAADRAAHLVQFIVNGQTETPEYELPLNKILCGISTGLPISAGITVTEQEQTLIEQMLNSMIQHWKVLGSTSIAGLRETFFQRQGWLVLEEDCWRLKVQERSFDMLLDRLPWSIALIKHGWMDKPLRVSWRNHS